MHCNRCDCDHFIPALRNHKECHKCTHLIGHHATSSMMKSYLTVTNPNGIAIRRSPEFPSERVGQKVQHGETIPFDSKLKYHYQKYMVTFYLLSDGRGWIHNFVSHDPQKLNGVKEMAPQCPKYKVVTFVPGPWGVNYVGNCITQVNFNSQAYQQGVREGWIIIAVNDNYMDNNHEQVRNAIHTIKASNEIARVLFSNSEPEMNNNSASSMLDSTALHHDKWFLPRGPSNHCPECNVLCVDGSIYCSNCGCNMSQDMETRIEFDTSEIIGLMCQGNRIWKIPSGSQLERAGVQVGWIVAAINGVAMPDNSMSIMDAISSSRLAHSTVSIVFIWHQTTHTVDFSAHDEDPWGISITFDDHWSQWRVNAVHRGNQAERKGVKRGDKIVAVDGVRIDISNANMMQEKLMQGAVCQQTFVRPVIAEEVGHEEKPKKNSNECPRCNLPCEKSFIFCSRCGYEMTKVKKLFSKCQDIQMSVQDIIWDLAKHEIDDDDSVAIADILKLNQILRVLDCGFNKIGDIGASALGNGLINNSTLTQLEIQGNYIGDVGARKIGESLKRNQTLTRLILAANEIGERGARGLAEGIKQNSALQTLILNNNRIGHVGAIAIGNSLERNSSLTNLELDENNIGDQGMKALGEGLSQNTTLTSLDLRSNYIGDVGATEIGEALKDNVSLKELCMHGNTYQKKGKEALLKHRKKDDWLSELYYI